MLIVSKFHDYYDSCASTGVDKTVVYSRKNILIDYKYDKLLRPYYTEKVTSNSSKNRSVYNVKKILVGFCGQIYPLVQFEKLSQEGEEISTDEFYSLEGVEGYIRKESLTKGSKRVRFHFSDSTIDDIKSFESFFNPNTWSEYKKIFREKNVPVFAVGRGKSSDGRLDVVRLELSPKLSKIKFMKVKDPFSAYQEIYMFISGYLGVPSPSMVKISDKDMAKSKGHDGIYSFKKPPGGGRWR